MVKNISVYPCIPEEERFTTPEPSTIFTTVTETPTTSTVTSTTTPTVSTTPSITTVTETPSTTTVTSTTTPTVSTTPSTTTVTETPTASTVTSTTTPTVSTTPSTTTVTETPTMSTVTSTTTPTTSTTPSTTTMTETPTTTTLTSTTTPTESTTLSTTTVTETPTTSTVTSTTTPTVSTTPSTTSLTETSTTTTVTSTSTPTTSTTPSTTTVTKPPTTTTVTYTTTPTVSTTTSTTTVTETPTTSTVISTTTPTVSSTPSTTTVTETPTTSTVTYTTTPTTSTTPSTTTVTETPTTTTLTSTTTPTASTTPSTTTVTFCTDLVPLNNETIAKYGVVVSGPYDGIVQAISSKSNTQYYLHPVKNGVVNSVVFDLKKAYELMMVEFESQYVDEVAIKIQMSTGENPEVLTERIRNSEEVTRTTKTFPRYAYNATMVTLEFTKFVDDVDRPAMVKNISVYPCIPEEEMFTTPEPSTIFTTVTETPTTTTVPSTSTSTVSTTPSTATETETPTTSTVPSTTISTVSTTKEASTTRVQPTTTTRMDNGTTPNPTITVPSSIVSTITYTQFTESTTEETILSTTTPRPTTPTVSTSTVISSSTTTVILTTFTTTPHVCYINSSAIPDLPNGDIVGYIEKDGTPGFTDESEAVKDGEMISEGVVVHIKCNNCSCAHGGKMACVPEEPCRSCIYEPWSEWSECSVTCGGSGWKTRTRKLLSGILLCRSMETEDKFCSNEERCEVTSTPSCSTWSTWSSCDCQTNSRSRSRAGSCVDFLEEEACTEGCNTTSTPKPCEDPEIRVPCYNMCDDSCRNLRLPGTCTESDKCIQDCQCPAGMRRLQGKCVNETKCPCYTKEGEPVLSGFEMPTDKPCEKCKCNQYNEEECTPITGCCEMGPWTEWSTCSETCGDGIRKRERSMYGDNCDPEEREETEACNMRTCPPVCLPDYKLGDVMSNCTCEICYCAGDGTKKCEPKADEIVDGGLTPWSAWGECSKGCDGGTHMRNRSCTNPPPRCGGMICTGNLVESEPCNKDVSCCDVTDWSPWSECDSQCGPGNMTRSRNYKGQSSSPPCNKYLTETVTCTDVEPCDTKCVMSDWTDWSKCSVTCGSGSRFRNRIIESGSPQICKGVDTFEEVGCHEVDCTCEPPFVWRNDSLCHSQTCDRRVTNDDCADKLLPACVCPENMYLKDGKCVNIVDCFKCEVNGVVYRNGETWTPRGTCDMCQCIMGREMCEPLMKLPVCEVGETITYEDGPCCPKCRTIQSCQLHNKTETLVLDNCKTAAEVTYQYCAGTCGSSKSAPMLSMSNGAIPATVDDCKCCKGTTTGTREVRLQCDNRGSIEEVVGYLPLITACQCNTCE